MIKLDEYKIQIAEATEIEPEEIPDDQWQTIVEGEYLSEVIEGLIDHLNGDTPARDPQFDQERHYVRLLRI
jgi:hypothetical protein